MANIKSKKPTNKDVARIAGVSVATVSYVINGRSDQKISESTKKKVLHAINFLGYIPNPHAVAMKTSVKDIVVRSSKSNTLLQNIEVFAMLKEFTPICSDKGYAVSFSAETEPSRVTATACVCIDLNNDDFHALANENFVPVIAVDSILNDPVFYQVCADYDNIKSKAEEAFGDDYLYLTIAPNNVQLKAQILSVLPNTVFITDLTQLQNPPRGNIVVSDFILSQLLKDNVKLSLTDYKRKRLSAVVDCVEKAVNREVVPDDMHFIKI